MEVHLTIHITGFPIRGLHYQKYDAENNTAPLVYRVKKDPLGALFVTRRSRSAIGQRKHVPMRGTHKQLARTTDFLFGIGDHFVPLSDPAHRTRHREDTGE